VAILSAAENADAALIMATADSSGIMSIARRDWAAAGHSI
jgi:hypothetical protein